MAEPRTRSRMRPNTQDNRTEQKVAGERVSSTKTTDHKPAGEVELFSAGPSLRARIHVVDGVTLNMGDYNSFRREIGLELDIDLGEPGEDGQTTAAQDQMIDAAYDRVQTWIEDKLDTVIDDAQQYFEDMN